MTTEKFQNLEESFDDKYINKLVLDQQAYKSYEFITLSFYDRGCISQDCFKLKIFVRFQRLYLFFQWKIFFFRDFC